LPGVRFRVTLGIRQQSFEIARIDAIPLPVLVEQRGMAGGMRIMARGTLALAEHGVNVRLFRQIGKFPMALKADVRLAHGDVLTVNSPT
jgi:hypothetical protein